MTTVRVSVPVYAVGSRMDFHFSGGVAVVQLPFEALGDAEVVRQIAFHMITYHGGRVNWHVHSGRYEGSLELDSAEVRSIAELADLLAEAKLVA